MKSLFVLLPSLLLLLNSMVLAANDYYWHDYTGGEISSSNYPNIYYLDPTDSDGQKVYIGQVYVHNYGIFVAKIKEGLNSVQVAAYGVHEQALADNLVKVLCASPRTSLELVNANTSTFYQVIENGLLTPVPGGYDHVSGDSGVLDIGITNYEGQIEVGSIRAYDRQEPYLTIAYEGEEVRIDNFHVLVRN